ncbi:MAG: prepilin-type N-terminal cleavage/methylation domain-containing protein [bacterium]
MSYSVNSILLCVIPQSWVGPRIPRRRRDRKKGFTLVEAILAMSILAISVTGILGSFTGALVGGSVAEDYAKASIRIQQVMAQIRAGAITPYDINQGTFSGDNKFRWSVSFTEVDIDYLYEVEVKILWTRAHRERELKLTTYQYCDPLALPVMM